MLSHRALHGALQSGNVAFPRCSLFRCQSFRLECLSTPRKVSASNGRFQRKSEFQYVTVMFARQFFFRARVENITCWWGWLMLRSLPMASRSGMEPSWPWTPPLSHPSLEMASPDAEQEGSQECRLVVLAIEVGGRWSEEAAAFINNLARAEPDKRPPSSNKALRPLSPHDGPPR